MVRCTALMLNCAAFKTAASSYILETLREADYEVSKALWVSSPKTVQLGFACNYCIHTASNLVTMLSIRLSQKNEQANARKAYITVASRP